MLNEIKQIKRNFDEIEKYRVALKLFDEDGIRRSVNELQIAPSSHIVNASDIFGREREKEELIDLLLSESQDGSVVSVVAIVGPGGLGKTTLAQLACDDKRIRQRFDKLGWVCVSEDFNIERLTKESLESITGSECGIKNLSTLQNKIIDALRGIRVLLVLDDVWNEKRSLWDLFNAPFKFASFAKILVTTRNQPVARIMQTVPTFNLSYLSEEQCWQLFVHYAFDGVDWVESSNLVEIGKQFLKKCGMLPLAVKSVACLLRHERQEDSWREILESELWESDVSNEIFPSLQISYARLPTHLKPCLIFCSMFPRDYEYNIYELVDLWISHGYIQSKDRKIAENVGFEYGRQLWQRSFFESRYEWPKQEEQWCRFKLHDMIHDLARFNSKNGCCSIEAGTSNNIPSLTRVHHLYIEGNFKKPLDLIPFDKFSSLRTLIMECLHVENFFNIFDFSMTEKLRVLKIDNETTDGLNFFSSIRNLKHLRYLSLGHFSLRRLPEGICSFYNLQNLKLRKCSLCELPTSIGNIVSLEKLTIEFCPQLKRLPESICQLKALRVLVLLSCKELEEIPSDIGSLINLQTLKIDLCGIRSLPPSCNKLTGIQTLRVFLYCETIGWLKDFVGLSGTLRILGLKNIPNLTDVQCANLRSMGNLKDMYLEWNDFIHMSLNDENGFCVAIKRGQHISPEDNKSVVLAGLQPHPNLRKLSINNYVGNTLSEWIEDPSSCPSLEYLSMSCCENLKSIPFGSLQQVKYMQIYGCHSLQIIRAESLPSSLQTLVISLCGGLISVPGILKLKCLVGLCIQRCNNLQSLIMDAEPTVLEYPMHTNKSSYQNSLLSLKNLTSLRSLYIGMCPNLQLMADELLCVQSCDVKILLCPLLKQWCLKHDIHYED